MDFDRIMAIGLVAVAIIAILTTVSCTMHQDRRITEMVESGANPIDASCAIKNGRDGICQTRAMK